MIPAGFAYSRPASLDEAMALLAQSGGGAKVLAGGMSLLPLLKIRLASVDRLVDIGRLPELKGVRQLADGRLAIGAMTTYDELASSPAARLALVADALPEIGDVQVRNRGTIGGAIAHADPASDIAACLLALDAEVVARSPRGERVLAVDGFFTGAFQSALASDEIVTEIRLPGPRDDAGSAFVSITQPASGYSMAGAAAVVGRASAGGPISFARVALTGVGEHPYRAKATEAALAGGDGSPEAVAEAAALVTAGVTVQGDIHADPTYRAAMAAVMARRAVARALARLG